MYIESVPNRNSPPAILLRESFREGSRIRKRTLANISDWPPERIEALRAVLKGKSTLPGIETGFEILRSRPHGHVAAVLGMVRELGVEKLLGARRTRELDLVVAMIIARIIAPASKLATARDLRADTLSSTIGEMLGVADATSDQLYTAMDWLLDKQNTVEARLADRHLKDSVFVLYDLTSTYFEGRGCPLAKLGHSRDGKKGKLQVVFGLLCEGSGRPVSVEVFAGNTGDPKTVPAQVEKLRQRFGMKEVVLIADRGMLTDARIRQDVAPSEGFAWITALRAPAIQRLVRDNELDLSAFQNRDMAEFKSQSFSNERLVACRNRALGEHRASKRLDMLKATENALEVIAKATRRQKNPLVGKAEIGMRVGRVLSRFKMAKHFRVQIGSTSLRYDRKQENIDKEAALDGFYVIRSSVPASVMSAPELVSAYKSLSSVERAFRSCKTVDLHVRPIHHRLEGRVRSHIFLCMLAYYVEWHMRKKLAPMLFDDEHHDNAQEQRTSPVAPAVRSATAMGKAESKHTDDGTPVHSFRSVLRDLATIAKNRIRPKADSVPEFDQLTVLTPLQQKAFDLLGFPCRS